MIDRAWRVLFRDFWTFFAIAACVAFPLHVGYSFAFRDVIAVDDLAPDIAELRRVTQVRGVGPPDLDRARASSLGVAALELVLLPLVVGATMRAAQVLDDGGVPTVPDAWRGAAGHLRAADAPPLVPLAVAGVFAIALGALVQATGNELADLVPRGGRWALQGIVDAGARAVAAPFFLVAAAELARNAKGRGGLAP